MTDFDDDIPYAPSGKKIPALERLAGNTEKPDPKCRMCDGSGWFYGDKDIGQCPCVGDKPMYGYWLHAESNSGGIYRTMKQRDEILGDLVEEVSFEEYRKARDAGWQVDWTENEEL